MSRRTLIKPWNPNVPIGGGRSRGRGRRKKGSDLDEPFGGAYRTIHDPDRDRSPGGRDTDTAPRFYSASGLTASGLPQQNDRFRAFTVGGTRGGRGGKQAGIQQRAGMFRNAIQSGVIFGKGALSDKSRRRIDRLLAPEEDESVREWRKSPILRAIQRRRDDAYEYDSEDEEEEEEGRGWPIRRVSNPRRAPAKGDRRTDPDYDPYEFRDDDSEEEAYTSNKSVRSIRQRLSNSRVTIGLPSTSRSAYAKYANDRRSSRDERTRPRRLFDGATDEEEEEARGRRQDRREEERGRRQDRREEERGRGPQIRGDERQDEHRMMETRNNKRVRELSPVDVAPPVSTRQPISHRYSHKHREPAAVTQSSEIRLKEKKMADDGKKEKIREEPYYTPSIAKSIARRILSGLPPIRLKNDSGSETYLSASRSIIAGALERFEVVRQDTTEGDPSAPDGQPRTIDNAGQMMMRALFDRTQRIDLSEESGDDSEEEGRGAYENIFSRHSRDGSPVLERLFDQTMRAASALGGSVREEEVDTANLLGLNDTTKQQQPPSMLDISDNPFAIAQRTSSGSTSSDNDSIDPFAMPPRVAGDSTASQSSSDSSSSLFSDRSHRHLSMTTSHHTTHALMEPSRGTREAQRMAAGSGAFDRSSSSHSSERSMGGMGETDETGFPFGISRSARSAAPTNPFGFTTDDGSFDFEF